jgi:hypothetical protein
MTTMALTIHELPPSIILVSDSTHRPVMLAELRRAGASSEARDRRNPARRERFVSKVSGRADFAPNPNKESEPRVVQSYRDCYVPESSK